MADWNIRDFHGYSTEKGTTYNAYLIVDDKITLFDTVKKPFKNDLLHCIYKVIDPSKIDYLVVNHVEPDHSGSIAEMMDIIKPEKLICSPRGKKALMEHYHREDWPYEVVASGQEISIGKRTVQFLETRMVHWPDSMFSYVKEDALLISSDAFGQHWATSERFNDEVDSSEAHKACGQILCEYTLAIFGSDSEVDRQRPENGSEDQHDSPGSRPDLASQSSPDRGLLCRVEPTGSQAKGRDRIRHNVAQHGNHGQGRCRRTG